jgi:hypothetical protein
MGGMDGTEGVGGGVMKAMSDTLHFGGVKHEDWYK